MYANKNAPALLGRRTKVPMFGNHNAASAPAQADVHREAAISAAALRLQFADSVDARSAAWLEMKALIAGRSPAAIAHIEKERGLDHGRAVTCQPD